MATEGFDAAKAAVDQMNLMQNLKGPQQMTSGQANPLANASSILQHVTGLKDFDYGQALSTQGLLQDVSGPLFSKRKGALGSMFDGLVTFEWTPHIESVHGTGGMPEAAPIQTPDISAPSIGRGMGD